MNRFSRLSGARSFVGALATAALIATLTGCSGGDERGYAAPRALCGITMDSDDLVPFLPSGSKISTREKSQSGVKRCEVVIDDKLIVTTTQAWLEEGRTTAYFASGQSLHSPEKSADGGRFRYSGNEAFGKTRGCVDSQHKQELYTAVQAQGSKHEDVDAMKRLIVSFTREVQNSAECRTGTR
jgi:Arc/MetJ family transcription regulator